MRSDGTATVSTSCNFEHTYSISWARSLPVTGKSETTHQQLLSSSCHRFSTPKQLPLGHFGRLKPGDRHDGVLWQRIHTLRWPLALGLILLLQLTVHAVFPFSPLPAIAEGWAAISNTAARLVHHSTSQHAISLSSSGGIPLQLHVYGNQQHQQPLCAQLSEGWQVHWYSDSSAAAFVARQFPQHERLFQSLQHGGDRVRLLQLMVLLRHGGVWLHAADCVQPLEQILGSSSMVVGWQGDEATNLLALHFMAARANHPVLADMLLWIETVEGPQLGVQLQRQLTQLVAEHTAKILLNNEWSMTITPAAVLDGSAVDAGVTRKTPTATAGNTRWGFGSSKGAAFSSPAATPAPQPLAMTLSARPVTVQWTSASQLQLILPPLSKLEETDVQDLLYWGWPSSGKQAFEELLRAVLGRVADQPTASVLEIGRSVPLFAFSAAQLGLKAISLVYDAAAADAARATVRVNGLRDQVQLLQGGFRAGAVCMGSTAERVESSETHCSGAYTLDEVLSTNHTTPKIISIKLPLNAALHVLQQVPSILQQVQLERIHLEVQQGSRNVSQSLAQLEQHVAALEAMAASLQGLGYADVAHMGPMCALRLQQLHVPAHLPNQVPTWCTLAAEDWALFLHDVFSAKAGLAVHSEHIVLQRQPPAYATELDAASAVPEKLGADLGTNMVLDQFTQDSEGQGLLHDPELLAVASAQAPFLRQHASHDQSQHLLSV